MVFFTEKRRRYLHKYMNTFLVFTIQIQKLLSVKKVPILQVTDGDNKILNSRDLIQKISSYERLFVITTFIHSSSRMFLKSTLFKIICCPLLVTLPKFNLVESGTKLKEYCQYMWCRFNVVSTIRMCES